MTSKKSAWQVPVIGVVLGGVIACVFVVTTDDGAPAELVPGIQLRRADAPADIDASDHREVMGPPPSVAPSTETATVVSVPAPSTETATVVTVPPSTEPPATTLDAAPPPPVVTVAWAPAVVAIPPPALMSEAPAPAPAAPPPVAIPANDDQRHATADADDIGGGEEADDADDIGGGEEADDAGDDD